MRTRFRIHKASLGLLLSPIAVGGAGTAGQFASLHPPGGTAPGAPAAPPNDDRKIDRGDVATRA